MTKQARQERNKINCNREEFSYAIIEEPENELEDEDEHENKKKDFIHRIRASIIMNLRKRLQCCPCLSRIIVGYISLLPPKCFVVLMLWKIYVWSFILSSFIHYAANSSNSIEKHDLNDKYHSHIRSPNLNHINSTPDNDAMKIIYIVTSLSEYNSRNQGNLNGQDRLQEILIPTLKHGVESILDSPHNWKVDVYLILGYSLSDERKKLIVDAIPDEVGLEVWNDATPLGYDRNDFETIRLITRSLARQHRFVIADKLDQYDFFSVWEDDMYISSQHIQYYLEMSSEIERLKEMAKADKHPTSRDAISGPLSYEQLQRVFPGFVRVEVLQPESKSQSTIDSIPIDLDFTDYSIQYNTTQHVNPQICCFVPTNPKPASEQIVLWEVGIKGYSVREFPHISSIGWVALQPGPDPIEKTAIHGYWSGQGGAFGLRQRKPSSREPQLFGQQGGFIATKQQILLFQQLCEKEFLPPFKTFRDDGLYMMNVEFWSGGFQLWGYGNGGCNLQRIISLEPELFSKHLIYHTSNNKQHSLSKERFVKADHLLGQLNSVKKAAQQSLL